MVKIFVNYLQEAKPDEPPSHPAPSVNLVKREKQGQLAYNKLILQKVDQLTIGIPPTQGKQLIIQFTISLHANPLAQSL